MDGVIKRKSWSERMKDFRDKYDWETEEESELVSEMVHRASARFLAYRRCKNTQCEFYLEGDYCSSRKKVCGIKDESVVSEESAPYADDDETYEDNPTNADIPLAVRYRYLLKFAHKLQDDLKVSNSRLIDIRKKYDDLCRIFNANFEKEETQAPELYGAFVAQLPPRFRKMSRQELVSEIVDMDQVYHMKASMDGQKKTISDMQKTINELKKQLKINY